MSLNPDQEFDQATKSQISQQFVDRQDKQDSMLFTPDKNLNSNQIFQPPLIQSNQLLIPISPQNYKQNSKETVKPKRFETQSKFGIFQHQPLIRKTWKSEEIISEDDKQDISNEKEKLIFQNSLKQNKQNQNIVVFQQQNVTKKNLSLYHQQQIIIYPNFRKNVQNCDFGTSIQQEEFKITQPQIIFRLKKSQKTFSFCQNQSVKKNPVIEKNQSIEVNKPHQNIHILTKQKQRNSNKFTSNYSINQFQYFPIKLQKIKENKSIQTNNKTQSLKSGVVKYQFLNKQIIKISFGQQTENSKNKINVSIGTQNRTQYIQKTIDMNINHQHNFQHYLEKQSKNFQTLIKDLLENQQINKNSKIERKNFATQCYEHQINNDKNLKRKSINKKNNTKKKDEVRNCEGESELEPIHIQIIDDSEIKEPIKKRRGRGKKKQMAE